MTFELSDQALTCERTGSDDVTIRFDEVVSIRRAGYWFEVRATEPDRKIIIPESVKGYNDLVAEMRRRSPPSALGGPPRAKRSWSAVVLLIVAMVSWSAFEAGTSRKVTIAALVAGLATLLLASQWMLAKFGGHKTRWPAWAMVASSWLAALAAVAIKAGLL